MYVMFVVIVAVAVVISAGRCARAQRVTGTARRTNKVQSTQHTVKEVVVTRRGLLAAARRVVQPPIEGLNKFLVCMSIV